MEYLPPPFQAQMQTLLGNQYLDFLKAFDAPTPTSIHLNFLRKFKLKENSGQVKWNYDNAYYLPQRPIFTLDPAFHAGAYYVQEASSMFLAEAARQSLDINQHLRILDLCAAPGGKSTLLASFLAHSGCLLANEVIQSRYGILRQNLQKWGYSNTHTSHQDSRDFGRLNGFFDAVLVDAPCSGEGLFRKDEKAMKEWSLPHVQFCAARQKRILAEAANLVKSGGVLFYSTCTYNPSENKDNVQWLLQNFDFELIKLQLPKDWGIVEQAFGYQFFPHLVQGEGLFLSCLRKKQTDSTTFKTPRLKGFKTLNPIPKKQKSVLSEWLNHPEALSFFTNYKNEIIALPNTQLEDCQRFDHILKKKNLGVNIGQIKGKDFIPSHALALSHLIHPALPSVELTKQEALLFLKKESLTLPNAPQGWVLASYEGLNLGWMKVLTKRINNYFPKEWRIRMAINIDTD